jgi:diguanylate cyclase (GGDEF)-like protein
LFKQASAYDYSGCDWRPDVRAAEPIPAELTLVRFKYGDEYAVAAYTRDLRKIKKMEENIHRLETEVSKIYYDPLTGIYNRRFFDENLKRVLKTLSRSNGMLSLLMIDIDHFKEYNDTYGHSDGDNCLKIVAKALKKAITRTDDFVARYGGEEFVVVLPNTDKKGAHTIAGILLKSILDCNIPHEKNDAANSVTISIGAATGKVTRAQSGDDYIQRADEMLYKSKQSGRNTSTLGVL